MTGKLDSLITDIKKDKLNFLFIGASGTGKTYASALLKPPALFIDTEGGLRTVAAMDDTGAKTINIQGDDKPWETMINVVIPTLLQQDQFPTIVLDSLTGLSNLYYRQVAGVNPAPSHTLKNYGQTIDRLRQTVSKLKTAKANVIFITTELAIVSDNDVVDTYIPNVAGKETFARELPAHVDEVWFFVINEERSTAMVNGKPITERRATRKIITAPTGQRIGKDRDGVLKLEEEIDFDELRRKLEL